MGYYDIAQVCSNGHMVNDSFHSSPQFNQDHCSECGGKTTTKCPACNSDIKGDYKGEVVVIGFTIPTPTHCHACGKAYPWKAKAQNLEKKSKKKSDVKPILERIKNTAIVGVVLAILGAIGYIGDFWQKLPQEWRSWFVNNIPQIQIKMPQKK